MPRMRRRGETPDVLLLVQEFGRSPRARAGRWQPLWLHFFCLDGFLPLLDFLTVTGFPAALVLDIRFSILFSAFSISDMVFFRRGFCFWKSLLSRASIILFIAFYKLMPVFAFFVVLFFLAMHASFSKVPLPPKSPLGNFVNVSNIIHKQNHSNNFINLMLMNYFCCLQGVRQSSGLFPPSGY